MPSKVFGRRIALATLLVLALPGYGVAQTDRVRLVDGRSEAGRVESTTARGVVLVQDGEPLDVPVVEIRAVLFGGEPAALTQARINAANGGYQTALEKLRTIDGGDLDRDLVKDDARFWLAYCESRLAIVGAGDAKAAGRKLSAFLKQNRDSFHYYRAVETLGDLLASLGRFDRAEKTYALLAEAPFASLRLRAGVLVGRVLQKQGEHDAAIAQFDGVLRADAGEAVGAGPQRLAARLGKATSLAETERLDEGLGLVREVLAQADESEATLLAKGYNTLGRCHEAAGQPLDALFAYLHTDLLFDSDPESHAEALARLSVLWKEIGKPDDAREALQRLRRRYAQSVWAREAG